MPKKLLTKDELLNFLRNLVDQAPDDVNIFISLTWYEGELISTGVTFGKGCPKCAVDIIKLEDESGKFQHTGPNASEHKTEKESIH